MTEAEKELMILKAEKVLAKKIFNVLESFAESTGDLWDGKNVTGWQVIIRTLEDLLKEFKERHS